MIESVLTIIRNKYKTEPIAVKELGGGFYGRAFLVSLDVSPYLLVAKLYLFTGIAAEEAAQISLLSKYSLLKLPRIFDVGLSGETGCSYDYILMEYLPGKNLGNTNISTLTEASKNRIANQIADNLIAYHNVSNPKGFGKIDGSAFCATWQEYYYPIACSVVDKVHGLYKMGQVNEYIVHVIDKSILQFDKIFCEEITKSSLIHGDYNTWNILLAKDGRDAGAVIDPYNCCWADNEYDLYQLDNANGKELGLLKLYRQKKNVSSNFNEKRRFYELYTELNHYYDSHVTVNLEPSVRQAKQLDEIM